MVRVAKAAVSAFALLVGVASAAPTWINLPTMSRQITPPQLLTTFNRDFVQRGQACPERITHTDANPEGELVLVPHTAITQNDQNCSNNGRMIISANQGNIPGFETALNNNENAQRVLSAIEGIDGATPLVGLQPNARVCGTTTLAANTILVFLREEFEVRVGPGLALPARQRFMLVMQPANSDPCVFVAGPAAATGPPPVAAPSADEEEETAAPAPAPQQTQQPAATVVPRPVAVPVPVGVPGADATESPETVPVVPVVPVQPAEPAEPAESPEDGEIDTGGVGGGVAGADGLDETPSESPDDDDICFPADATVQLEDGSVKTMEEVALNDKVVVNSVEHSDVFMFTHRMKESMNKFVKLSTADGSLTATAGHYIYVNDKLTAMRAVNVGDSLTRQDGSSAVVTKIEQVVARGLFNPQTLHGDIYVNGFKASTYTQSVEPTFAHTILAPFRALHQIGMNPLATAFEKGSDFLVQFAPRGALAY